MLIVSFRNLWAKITLVAKRSRDNLSRLDSNSHKNIDADFPKE